MYTTRKKKKKTSAFIDISNDSPSSVTKTHVLEINLSFCERQVSCIHIILYLQQRGIWKLEKGIWAYITGDKEGTGLAVN